MRVLNALQGIRRSKVEKVFHVIRIITVPPVFAVGLLLTVYFMYLNDVMSGGQLLCGLIFLGFLPVLGYPLQKYIPYFRERGREGQRSLAMIFSTAGYIFGCASAFFTKASPALRMIYLEYLLCGIAMLIFNKGFHLKSSGHACGIVAPVLLLFQFGLHVPAMIGIVLIAPVLVSSVKTGRHTVLQLVGGCMIAAGCLILIKLTFVHFAAISQMPFSI